MSRGPAPAQSEGVAEKTQYSLIQEYALNHMSVLSSILGTLLIKQHWAFWVPPAYRWMMLVQSLCALVVAFWNGGVVQMLHSCLNLKP